MRDNSSAATSSGSATTRSTSPTSTLPPGTTKIDVALGIGDLLVRVPEHAALEIRAHADGGQVTVLGKTDEGTRPDEHVAVRGSTSAAPTLELDAQVGFGHLVVRRG